jgi:hypothetical protein
MLQRVVAAIADLPGVAAITLGGSAAAGLADAASDLDVYVFYHEPLAATQDRSARLRLLADAGTLKAGLTTFGLEDHLYVQGNLIELVYFDLDRLSAETEQAYGAGLSSEGYTTSFLYTLCRSEVLHDATGEATALRAQLQAGYPEPTRARLLREYPEVLVYYLGLLRVGQGRNDLLFVQHLRYSIQMIFFNLLFALNRQYHPGGKRLLAHALRCEVQPTDLDARWNDTTRLPADAGALAEQLEALIDDLIRLIKADR